MSDKTDTRWAVSDFFLLGGVLFGALLNVVKLSLVSTLTWDTTIPEDAIVYSILAVARGGHALYQDFTQFPYATSPYGPLYYGVTGLIGKLLGGDVAVVYLVGRGVSLASLAMCLRLVYVLSRWAGASSRSAWFAVLLACTLPVVFPWAASCRPDFPAMAFSLWGITLLRREEPLLGQPRALWAWVAAFFMKSSFIAAPVAWGVYLLIIRKDVKAAVRFGVSYALITGGLCLLMEWLSRGQFYNNIVVANMSSLSWEGLYKSVLPQLLPVEATVFAAGMISGLIGCKYGSANERMVGWFAILSTLLFGVATLKSGAAPNYFIEPLFLWSAMLGVMLDRLRKWAIEIKWVRLSVVCIALSFLATMCAVLVSPREPFLFKQLTWVSLKDKMADLDSIINDTPGEILFISNGQGMRLNRGVTLYDGYNASYLETEHRIDLTPLAKRIENREFSAILSLDTNYYYDYSFLPPSFLDAVVRNYKISLVELPSRWMEPRETPLLPYVSAYPDITSSETLVFNPFDYTDADGATFKVANHGMIMADIGWIEKEMEIPNDGEYQFDLLADSTEFPGDLWAQASVSVGMIYAHTFEINRPDLSRFSVRAWLPKGRYPVRISFLNWQYKMPYELYLLVNKLTISPVPGSK